MDEEYAGLPDFPIVSVLLHVPDWRAATQWYVRAFETANQMHPDSDDYGHLDVGGVSLEIVDADDKVSCGPAGSVVYWSVENLDSQVTRLQAIGGVLYRGPLNIAGGDKICQVQDPWGNCIGLRQPFKPLIV